MSSKRENNHLLPLKLAYLLELDSLYPNPKALAESLGDRFLYSNNFVFRNLRDLVLKAGYQFDVTDKMNYRCAPFTCLQRILRTQTIPYMPTVTYLDALEKSCGGLDFDFSELVQRNPIIHESAHGICNTLLPINLCRDFRAKSSQILRHHMGEAFALTAEVMGLLFIVTQSQKIFYNSNAYIGMGADNSDLKLALHRLINSQGFAHTFKLVMVSFLYSLCLYQNIGSGQKNRIRKVMKGTAPWSSEELLALKFIIPFTFGIPSGFRLFTTSTYFKLWGLDEDMDKIHNFEPMSVLYRNGDLLEAVEILSDFALLGIKSKFAERLDKDKIKSESLVKKSA